MRTSRSLPFQNKNSAKVWGKHFIYYTRHRAASGPTSVRHAANHQARRGARLDALYSVQASSVPCSPLRRTSLPPAPWLPNLQPL